jgi:hypothetical protein
VDIGVLTACFPWAAAGGRTRGLCEVTNNAPKDALTMNARFAADLHGPATSFPHFWEYTVGSGHATLALRADWQAQLKRANAELGMKHVRFHGLLSDDMGTLVCENDTLLYSFFNTDQIFDFLLSIGMKPFVGIELHALRPELRRQNRFPLSSQRHRAERLHATNWHARFRKSSVLS